MTKQQWVTSIVGLGAIIALVGGIVGAFVGLEQAFNAGLTAGLVYVTATYVYLTSKTLETANRQAEIMLNAEFNAAAPVIKLEAGVGKGKVFVNWQNVGKGPALNFQCWIEDEEHPELRGRKMFAQVVAVGDPFSQREIDTGIQNYALGVGYIKARYQSIFKKTYESILIFPTNDAPQLEYGEAKAENKAESSCSVTSEENETQLDRIEKKVKNIESQLNRQNKSSLFYFLYGLGIAIIVASPSIGFGLLSIENMKYLFPTAFLLFLAGLMILFWARLEFNPNYHKKIAYASTIITILGGVMLVVPLICGMAAVIGWRIVMGVGCLGIIVGLILCFLATKSIQRN